MMNSPKNSIRFEMRPEARNKLIKDWKFINKMSLRRLIELRPRLSDTSACLLPPSIFLRHSLRQQKKIYDKWREQVIFIIRGNKKDNFLSFLSQTRRLESTFVFERSSDVTPCNYNMQIDNETPRMSRKRNERRISPHFINGIKRTK